ncbi:MAG: deoxyribose-phosphate aldolase [Elusimicrobiaceae bacterium]|nr:deoxyribose-phosphate aldolase [Elusimicrobiaceae bacterium]
MNLAKYIDHTLLKPQASQAEIKNLCEQAREYGFFSVCVNPYWVPFCKEQLKGSDVKVCTVIGFPLGANTTEVKVLEAKDALKNGADELDMVVNLGAVKSADWQTVLADIEAVRHAGENFTLKVIIETSVLTEEEKVKLCQLCTQAKADFVKTSTGFTGGGATAQDVKLMKENISADMQVKASGGVRTKEDFDKMVAAGATRIGASAGIKIIEGK